MTRLQAEAIADRYPPSTRAFRKGAERVILVGRRIMRANNHKLAFHNETHPLNLDDRADIIFHAIARVAPQFATERIQANTKVAIELHDVIQIRGNGRKRPDTSVERESATIAMDLMRRAGTDASTMQDRRDILRAIMITKGYYEDGTFVQPGLRNAQSITEVILALTDINPAGLPNGYQTTLVDCLSIFREFHPKSAEIESVLRGEKVLTLQEEKKYRKMIIDALRSQVAFVTGRMLRLPEETRSITLLTDYPEVQNTLLSLFNAGNFQRSIDVLEAYIQKLTDSPNITFLEIAQQMGFRKQNIAA